ARRRAIAVLADPADAVVDHAAHRLTELADPEQLTRPRDFLIVLLRDLALRFFQEPIVVVAHGTHGETARAVAEGPDHTQEPLPDAEPLVAGERRELRPGAVAPHELSEDADDRGEAELLGERRAETLVEPPVP